MRYKDNLNDITAYGDVAVKKIFDDGNTLTMHADEANFQSANQRMTAYRGKKGKSRV